MSVVEPNVLELLEHADSRYTLVVEAARRGREILEGSQTVVEGENLKPLKAAIEEINRGLLTYDRPVESEGGAEE